MNLEKLFQFERSKIELNKESLKWIDIRDVLEKLYEKIYYTYYKKEYCEYNKNSPCISPTYIHRIDDNFNNILPSNLELICAEHDVHTPYCTISRIFPFDSAHHLLNYEGPCKNPHGHTYKITVKIKKRINPETDMVMDYVELKDKVKRFIIDKFDHHDLNEIIPDNTTTENILMFVWNELDKKSGLKGISEISLSETESTIATITKNDMLECESYLESIYYDLLRSECN